MIANTMLLGLSAMDGYGILLKLNRLGMFFGHVIVL